MSSGFRLMLALALLWLISGESLALPAEEPTVVVGLTISSPLTITAGGPVQILYRTKAGNWVPVEKITGQTWQAEQENGKVLLLPNLGSKILSDLPLQFFPGDRGGRLRINGKEYPGIIEVWPDETNQGQLKIINRVKLEEYIRGVLAGEAYASWQPEALAAVAVAVRTYTLFNMEKKHQGFNFCDQTHCQKYTGYTSNPAFLSAAERTKGEVLLWQGRIINAVYHASSGGRTRNNEDIWEGEPLPYLRGVDDFDQDGKKYLWPESKLLSSGELITQLGLQGEGPLIVSPVFSEGFRPIAFGFRLGGEGKERIFRLEELRQIFNFPSPNFKVFKVSKETISEALAAGCLSLGTGMEENGRIVLEAAVRLHIFGEELTGTTVLQSNEELLFIGRGSGHGVGLSQWGAQGLALKGYDYRSILRHYYGKEVEISRAY